MSQPAARLLARVALCLIPLLPASVAHADPIRILMLGDSLTAGLGLPQDATLPTQLETALRREGRDVQIINAGVSGDTTAGGRARLAWSLEDGPDLLIVALGGNDGLRGLPPAETRRNLDAVLTVLGERGIPVLLAGMRAPRNLGAMYEDEFNAIYPALAATHHVALYPFLLEGVALDPTLNQPDGLHPNRAGVAVIVRGMLPHLLRLLETSSDGAP